MRFPSVNVAARRVQFGLQTQLGALILIILYTFHLSFNISKCFVLFINCFLSFAHYNIVNWIDFFKTYFLLQLHTNGIGLLQVDSVSPQLVTEGGELMVPPLPEGPLSQLKLMLSPRHCRETGHRSDVTTQAQCKCTYCKTKKDHTSGFTCFSPTTDFMYFTFTACNSRLSIKWNMPLPLLWCVILMCVVLGWLYNVLFHV